MSDLANFPFIAIDIETTGLEHGAAIFSAAIAFDSGSGRVETRTFFLDPESPDSLSDRTDFSNVLNATLFDPAYNGIVIFHNLDFDLSFLLRQYRLTAAFDSRRLCRMADTLALSRVARNNKAFTHVDPTGLKPHSLKFLAREHLGIKHDTFEDATQGVHIRLADRHSVLKYNAKDAEITYRLYHVILSALTPDERDYFERIESPHVLNLFHINFNGLKFDKSRADIMQDSISDYLSTLERNIFRRAMRTFNINSSAEVARALYFNQDLTYQDERGSNAVLQPPFRTESGHDKTSVEALQELLRRVPERAENASVRETLHRLIQYFELSKAQSQIETLNRFARMRDESAMIFPHYVPDARTGRVRCSRPNLLGLSKAILSKGMEGPSEDDIPMDLCKASVRQLFVADDGFEILSIDIDGLDLGVIAHLANDNRGDFPWLSFFGRREAGTIDAHYGVFQLVQSEQYREAFSDISAHLSDDIMDYWALKAAEGDSKDTISLLHKATNTKRILPVNDSIKSKARERYRKIIKQLNLGTSYLMGAKTLASKIQEVTEEPMGVAEAQGLLDAFYEAFPPIRRVQDRLANDIYRDGFVDSPFGRRYYADAWDDLRHSANGTISPESAYEFVCKVKGRYWYVKASGWKHPEGDIVDTLVVLDKAAILHFQDIESMVELDSYTFRVKGTKRRRPGPETSDQDESGFVLSRAEISYEVDAVVARGQSLSSEAIAVLKSWANNGRYSIPEASVVLYRAPNPITLSPYFKPFVPLLRSAKKAFPVYCQGIAADVAKYCLTYVRQQFEEQIPEARVLFFIHDEIVVAVPSAASNLAISILTTAIEMPKPPLAVTFTGSVTKHGRRWYER